MLLLPADVLQPRRPDDHFADEARALRNAGLDLALVDHDALSTSGGAVRAVARVPKPATGGVAIYRGWMLAKRAVRAVRAGARTTQHRAAHQP